MGGGVAVAVAVAVGGAVGVALGVLSGVLVGQDVEVGAFADVAVADAVGMAVDGVVLVAVGVCRTRGEGVLDAGGSTELCSKRKRTMETMTTAQNRISRVVFWQPVISNLYQRALRRAWQASTVIISYRIAVTNRAWQEDMEEGFAPRELQPACITRTSGLDVTRDRRNSGDGATNPATAQGGSTSLDALQHSHRHVVLPANMT